MDVIPIDDADDERLDPYRDLNDVDRRQAFDAASGTFIAEGWTVIERVERAGLDVRSVLCVRDRVHRLALGSSVPVFSVSRGLMAEVVGFDLHRGVIASVTRPPDPAMGDVAGHNTVAVLEGINDHQNLGAVLRAAAALGVGAIVLDPTCADPWYRRSVRVSMGAVAMLPIVRAESWPGVLHDLVELRYTTVALSPRSDGVPLFDLEVERPAFMLGAEGPGLTCEAVELAQVVARIPMTGDLDSLNVGQAAAIAFSWVVR